MVVKVQRQPVAFSYVRFSSKRQEQGDSVRRQDTGAQAWADRTGIPLDASLNLYDLGVSAYTGKNAKHGQLRAFLDAIDSGDVRPGDYLIVENLDRISRQGIDEGYELCKKILRAGVHIVTLSPERTYGPDAIKGLMKGALELQILLELAAEESKKKSERLGQAWGQKKKAAAKDGRKLGRRVPGWIRAEGEGDGIVYRLIPERAAVVRRIFTLAGSGYGIPSIIAAFDRDGVKTFGGRSKAWSRAYVGLILKDRRCLGEYQPMKGKAKDGPAVPCYYPAVITLDEYRAARAGAAQRKTHPGRTGKAKINVFAGLLKEAREGDAYRLAHHISKTAGKVNRKIAVLKSAAEDRGGATHSFPYDAFEGAVLSVLREVPASEVESDDATDAAAIEGELADVREQIELLRAQMARKVTASIAAALSDLDTVEEELVARLDEANQQAVCPLSAAWSDARRLSDVLASAEDQRDARLRMRAALRRVCVSMHMLVVRRGREALAAVQCYFAGGVRRDVLIHHRPAGGHRPEAWATLSFARHPEAGDFDLRLTEDVGRVAAVLTDLDLTEEDE